jgi:hypothetical protein
MERDNTTQIIRDTFFELSLCLEAIFLIHKADEDLVEAIMRNMEEIYNNATRITEQGEEHRSYPSVERFLHRLSGGRYVPSASPSPAGRV